MRVTWIGSPNFFPGRSGHNPNWTAADPNTWIVLHTTVSTRDSAASRFTSPAGGASPTYMVDLDGSIYQYVREEDGPWTNGVNDGVGSNLDSITIEHVDNKDYNGPRTPELYEASAQLVADIARRRGIPLIHRGVGGGVIGHREVASPGNQTACPDGLDVGRIIARANEILHPPPAPAPQPPAPPPDTRPEWETHYKDNPQSFTLYSTVPIISLVDGTGHAGTVPVGPLVVIGETHAFNQDWWVTAYGKQHAHGMLKSDVAKASTAPPAPPPTPAPEPVPAPPAPTPAPVPPLPAPAPPPPQVPQLPPGTRWQDWLVNLADHEIVALIEYFKEHLAKRSGG